MLLSATVPLAVSDTFATTFLPVPAVHHSTENVHISGRDYTPASAMQSYGSHGTKAAKCRWYRDLLRKSWNKGGEVPVVQGLRGVGEVLCAPSLQRQQLALRI
ncbi:hypothetical protein SBA7_1930003 [Candidatus Sulfotelmatobacter sp. SbA7]|nr:hypothetical protein SBA7_1930003 [Candidatus Sulfotelmatobacter sp. SbA7]